MANKIDITGQVFGRLTVVRCVGYMDGGVYKKWECLCLCGKVVFRRMAVLRDKTCRSCGCLQKDSAREFSTTHGKTKTPEWRIWVGLKSRCLNKRSKSYKNYGGRGIKVSERWLGENGFQNFLEDMGPKPSPDHSIDRYPNKDGNYEPGNCRWATRMEQNSNTRRNRWFTYKGKTQTISQWAREFGIHRNVLRQRLFHPSMMWDFEKSVTTPVGNGSDKNLQ